MHGSLTSQLTGLRGTGANISVQIPQHTQGWGWVCALTDQCSRRGANRILEVVIMLRQIIVSSKVISNYTVFPWGYKKKRVRSFDSWWMKCWSCKIWITENLQKQQFLLENLQSCEFHTNFLLYKISRRCKSVTELSVAQLSTFG